MGGGEAGACETALSGCFGAASAEGCGGNGVCEAGGLAFAAAVTGLVLFLAMRVRWRTRASLGFTFRCAVTDRPSVASDRTSGVGCIDTGTAVQQANGLRPTQLSATACGGVGGWRLQAASVAASATMRNVLKQLLHGTEGCPQFLLHHHFALIGLSVVQKSLSVD
ncbi:hypothetical protein [Bradyrhizobium sp.]|uniref:hypothetical protein n=1 Tax=Bradyrhizobium sp. TaxID=376 RepID=UPI0025BAA35D|nr:hypothetical protein [Bradyrhizobium sp.]